MLNLAATPIDVTGNAPVDSVKMTFGGIEGTGSILITKQYKSDLTSSRETYNAAPVYLTFTNSGQAPSKAHCSQPTTTLAN